MKKILLATIMLSIAMSENILCKMENHLKPKSVWIRDQQFWNRKIKRVLRNALSGTEDLVNYDDDKQLPQISNTRFISETKAPMAVIRRPNVARYSQIDLLSSDKSKENAKPTILISIDIQENKKTNEEMNVQDDCSAKKNYHRKNNQDWQLQEPFYVEEPRWIEIDSEYTDSSWHANRDPYILSRGKKNVRVKDPAQQIIENYEFFGDYPSKSKTSSMKNRVRRSAELNKKHKDSTVKQNNHYNSLRDNGDINNIATVKTENRDKKFSRIDKKSGDGKANEEKDISILHDIFVEKYKKDKLKNLAKKSPRKITKRNQMDDVIITNFADQEQKVQRKDDSNNITNQNITAKEDKKFNKKSPFASDTNIRNKRSALLRNIKFSEGPGRHKTYEIDWVNVNSKKDAGKNRTDVFERNKVYIDKLDDLSTHDDSFILSHGKNSLDGGRDGSNKNNANQKSIEKLWKIKYRKKLESEEEARNKMNKLEVNNDDAETTGSQLTNFDSKTFRIKNYPSNREKRNACETCKMNPWLQELWWKNIEKNIQDSLSLERRDKHSDILEGLRLIEPYIISRGKKALHEFKDNFFKILKILPNEDDANETKMKTFLNMISMEKYNNGNYDTNAIELSNKISSRNRRGELDEILIPYDPYYVARGKRADLNNFLIKTRLLQNQKFEIDTKQ